MRSASGSLMGGSLPAMVVIAMLQGACASPTSSGSSPSPRASASAPRSLMASPTAPAPTGTAPATPPALAWSRLAAVGPAAREDHTWTVDDEAEVAYLFGGRDGSVSFADLWVYDLAADAWTELAPASPPPARFGHEAAWVDGVGLVVFGGQAGTAFFNDLWAYDAASNAWSQLPSDGAVPVPRYGSCSAVGPDDRLWISHGFTSDGARFSDTLAYDFVSRQWSDETPGGEHPVERCLHACWVSDAGELTLYAGQTTGVAALGDRWTLGAAGWREVAGVLPPERNLPAHARIDGATVVFGGMGLDAAFLDDLWLLGDEEADGEMLTPGGETPAPRSGASMVTDTVRDRVLLFGGRGADGAFGDTWDLVGVDGGL
ncbi:MAG TPA: kelch repeat-containing protein [Candidatus Limnocylindria bacterium]